jgi:valyl-tRNA synthetase
VKEQGEIIEPLLTSQWFMNMKELANNGIEVVKMEKLVLFLNTGKKSISTG